MTPARWAWLTLAIGIFAYDVACPPGQTMSEEVDRWLETRRGRFAAWLIGGVVVSHIYNVTPARVDPIHRLFTSLGRKSVTPET